MSMPQKRNKMKSVATPAEVAAAEAALVVAEAIGR